MDASTREFTATVLAWPDGRVYVELPFDPAEAWGAKSRHHITGSVNGTDIRGPLDELADATWVLVLGPAWRRGTGIGPGDEVTVVLAAEGPQRDSLPPDLAAALEAEPDAGAFFDSLATFYRTGYLRWLDGASRRPAVRVERLRELVALLKAGKKSRD
ncbi:MAG TPA: YdeI/OmpD-associated family protein [Armatimonadota bacterium]|nr:YdeI/OmpD-associated family protein [Armatimonadota bacterium]